MHTRTKKKTTPSSVTTPPAKASALAPSRSADETVRPQPKLRALGAAFVRVTGAVRGVGASDAGVGTLMISPMAFDAESRLEQLRLVAELAEA